MFGRRILSIIVALIGSTLSACYTGPPAPPYQVLENQFYRIVYRIPVASPGSGVSGPVTWSVTYPVEFDQPPPPPPANAEDYSVENGVVRVVANAMYLAGGNISDDYLFAASFSGFTTDCTVDLSDGDGVYWIIFTHGQSGCLPSSQFSYRLPYENGVEFRVNRDDLSHPSASMRYDLKGLPSETSFNVVAAREGRIELIVDDNMESSDPSSSDPNNYVWISHGSYNDDSPPVWQPQEWTKYSHLQFGSVPDIFIPGETFVSAGDPIGIEGNVGTTKTHLHFEVAVPDDPANPVNNGGFIIGINRIPRFCTLIKNLNEIQAGQPSWLIEDEKFIADGELCN